MKNTYSDNEQSKSLGYVHSNDTLYSGEKEEVSFCCSQNGVEFFFYNRTFLDKEVLQQLVFNCNYVWKGKKHRKKEILVGFAFGGPDKCILDSENCVKEDLSSIFPRTTVLNRLNAYSCNEFVPNQASIIESCKNRIAKQIFYKESEEFFSGTIAFVVIEGCVTLNFFNYINQKAFCLTLVEGALLVLENSSRFCWMFSISNKIVQNKNFKNRNILVVFRQLKESVTGRCRDPVVQICSRMNSNQSTMHLLSPSDKDCLPVSCDQIENYCFMKQYVYDVYDRIAHHFSNTRYKPWPKVKLFLESLPPGTLVLDAGCGNGKYLGCGKKIYTLGVDRSLTLAKLGNEKFRVDVCVDDCLRLNIRSESVDACISIAVLHHLSTEKKRLNALRELARCTRKGGRILLYVWAMEQVEGLVGSRRFDTQDVLVPWHIQKKQENSSPSSLRILNKNKTGHSKEQDFNINDCNLESQARHDTCEQSSRSIDENNSQNLSTLHRYYHVFTKEEILRLCSSVPYVSIIDNYFDTNNWAVILEKR